MKTVYFRLESGSVIKTNTPEVWSHDATATRISNAEGERLQREESRRYLLKTLKPGATVYSVLRHVSTSGMQRRIDFYAIEKNQPVFLTGSIANVLSGYRVHDKGGLIVDGAGMDMGFHIVSNLGMVLWPNGTTKPHGTRNGKPDNFGGYALKHEWI